MQFDDLQVTEIVETKIPESSPALSFDSLEVIEPDYTQEVPIEATVPEQSEQEKGDGNFITNYLKHEWYKTKTIGDVASEMAIGAVSFVPSMATKMIGEFTGLALGEDPELTIQISNQMAEDVHHFISKALHLGFEHQPTEDAKKALGVVQYAFTALRETKFKPIGKFYEKLTGSKLGGALTTDAAEILFFTALPAQMKSLSKKRLVMEEKAAWESAVRRDKFQRAMEAKLAEDRRAAVGELPVGKTRETFYKEGSVESIFGKEAAWEIDRAWAELEVYEAKQKVYDQLLTEEKSAQFLDDVEAFVERRDLGIEGKVKGIEIEQLYDRFIERQKEETVTFKKDWENWKKAEKHVADLKKVPKFDPREYMVADHMGKKMAVKKEPKTVDLKFQEVKEAPPLIEVVPVKRPRKLFAKKPVEAIKPKDRKPPVIEKQEQALSKAVEEIIAEEERIILERSSGEQPRKVVESVEEAKTAETLVEEPKEVPLETPGIPETKGDVAIFEEKLGLDQRATDTGAELLKMLKEIRKERAEGKVSTAPEMARSSEKVRELEIMDEMDNFFMEESPVYRNDSSYMDSMMDENVRPMSEVFEDMRIISEDILFSERGSLSFEKLPEAKKVVVKRLMKDMQTIVRLAARDGKKIGEFLLSHGYDERVAKVVEQRAKDITQSEKVEIVETGKVGNPKNVTIALEKARQKTKKFGREYIVEKAEAFEKELIARDGKVRRTLAKETDPLSWSEAHRAEMAKVAAANSSSAATQQFNIWKKQIFDHLAADERIALDNMIWVMKELDILRRHPKYKTMKGVKNEDLTAYYRHAQGELKLSDASMERVQQAAVDYFDAFRELLNTKRREGAIPEWLYQQLKDNTYSPTEWLHMQDMMQFANEKGLSLKKKGPMTIEEYSKMLEPHIKGADPKMSTNSSGLYRLKGGSEGYQKLDAYDLLETATQETWRWLMNNRANRHLADYAGTLKSREVPFEQRTVTPGHRKQIKQGNEYFDEIFFDEGGNPYFEYKKAPKGWKEINYFVDGARETIWAKDWFAEQWSLGSSEFRNQWSGTLRIASGSAFTREFATGAANPYFFVKGLPMDTLYSYARGVRRNSKGEYQSLYSPRLPVYLVELVSNWAKVAPDALTRSGEYVKAVEQGMGTNFLTQTGGVSPVFRGKLAQGMNGIRNFAGYMNTSAEVLMRLANREQFKKKGYSDWEATAAAWDMLAYDQGGRIAKNLDDVMAYTNVGIQATRGLVETAIKTPGAFAEKAAWVGGLATALYVWGRSKAPRAIDNEADWKKDNYWIIPTGKTITDHMGNEMDINLKIRKDPAQAIISTFAELMTARAMGEEANFKRLLMTLKNQLPYMQGLPVPPVLEGVLTYVTNTDLLTLEKVWHGEPAGEGEYYAKQTSKLWKDLGDVLGVSPERFKAAVEAVITRDSLPMKLAGAAYDELWREVPRPKQDGVLATFLIDNWGKDAFSLVREPNRWRDRAKELDVEGAKKYEEIDQMADLLIQGVFVTEEVEEERLHRWVGQLDGKDAKRVIDRVFRFHELMELPDRNMWFMLGGINDAEGRATLLHEWLAEHKDNPEKTEQIWEGIETLRQSSSNIIPKKSSSPFWQKFFELED